MLLHLTNHPALFVATTLIGNNVANYMTSLGIVLAVNRLFANSQLAEVTATIVLSPLVFVYCELLPKQLFFYLPNRLLRRSGTLLLFFTLLFAPVALLLWILGWLLEKLVGQTPLRVRLTLARKELQQVILEGEEAGVLHTAQRDLAQRLFARASQDIGFVTTPLSRVAAVRQGVSTKSALAVARRNRTAVIAVRESNSRDWAGYVRVIDLLLASDQPVNQLRPLPRLARNTPYLQAVMQLQEAHADVGLVEDRNGNVIGMLYTSRLTEMLFPEA